VPLKRPRCEKATDYAAIQTRLSDSPGRDRPDTPQAISCRCSRVPQRCERATRSASRRRQSKGIEVHQSSSYSLSVPRLYALNTQGYCDGDGGGRTDSSELPESTRHGRQLSGVKGLFSLFLVGLLSALPELLPGSRRSRHCIRSDKSTFATALSVRSTSSALVRQLTTLIRIARCPFQVVPLKNAVPSRLIVSMAQSVLAS